MIDACAYVSVTAWHPPGRRRLSPRHAGCRPDARRLPHIVRRGKIHAVLGENGAGKSTLIKIIAGVVQPDAGGMRLAGNDVSFATPSAANAAGVVCIF
jgi:ribose transport system ATP-binding protein